MNVFRILPLILMFFCSLSLFAQQEFIVQLAAYDVRVSDDYFDKLSGETISYYKDHYNFYHYFDGNKYASEVEAEAALSEVRAVYPNATVVDLQELKSCNYCCNANGASVYEESYGYKKVEPVEYKKKTVVAAPISFRELLRETSPKYVDVPPAPDPYYVPTRTEVTYTPPANNCMMPSFNPSGQEDFERIRRVANHYPGAIVYILPCAPEALQCYLSLRNPNFCGQQVSSREEVKGAINCPDVNSCVYIVDMVSGKVLDIAHEFREIVSMY